MAYDAIAKRGHGSNQIVQAQFKDLVPLHERADVGDVSLSRPSEEEVQETADRTRAALEKISKCKSFLLVCLAFAICDMFLIFHFSRLKY